MQGRPDIALPSILDELLEFSPALVQSRQVLPAIDWRSAKSEHVEKLLARLDAADVVVPQWLAIDLLCAGHTVPGRQLPETASALRVLSALNCPAVTRDEAAGLARDLEHAVGIDPLPGRLTQQMISRLIDLGLSETAIDLALGSYASTPEGLRTVRPLLDKHIAGLPATKLRVAGTSSTQTMATALRYTFAAHGTCAHVTDCGYASVMRELTRHDAPSDCLIVLLDQTYFVPQDWRRETRQLRADLDERVASLIDALKAYCARSQQCVLVTTLPSAPAPSHGFADLTFDLGSGRVCARVNQVLAEAAAANALICLIDTAQALAALPAHARHEAKLWFYGRFAYSDAATRHIAATAARLWHLRSKGPAKVLALDFDNTLWGGVYGDDGLERLQCGDDFPGSAYKAFQGECLRLKSQGMILVGLSKNNADALEVFDRHPGMLLKQDDFVATAVDWNSKPENIRKMASDLGLGLDAFLFIDDSPHEREAMRRLCPQVQCPDMPSDPAMRPEWIRALPATWPTRITDEDARRSGYYAAEFKSRELRKSAGSYEAYLSGLAQQLTVSPMTPATGPRIVQLHQRTNQFNLTNARFTEPELCRPSDEDRLRLVYSGQVRDRFGDHGLVIAAAIDIEGDTAVIQSFVMSCRVIGRKIEEAFLTALFEKLRERRIKRAAGIYRPNQKNAVAAKLYPDFGFSPEGTCNGADTWRLDLDTWCPQPSTAVSTNWSEIEC